jgi:hypothetical protein
MMVSRRTPGPAYANLQGRKPREGHVVLANGAGRLDVNDDAELHVAQIILGVSLKWALMSAQVNGSFVVPIRTA